MLNSGKEVPEILREEENSGRQVPHGSGQWVYKAGAWSREEAEMGPGQVRAAWKHNKKWQSQWKLLEIGKDSFLLHFCSRSLFLLTDRG